MTTFWLKIIAVTAMLLDHTGILFSNLSSMYQGNSASDIAMRMALGDYRRMFTCVGRLAFPIFAFLLVIGYTHTHDKKKYFSNLLIFAIVSQIPYSLLLYNETPSPEPYFTFITSYESFPYHLLLYALFALVCVLCYYWFVTRKNKDKSIFILIASFALLLLNYIHIGYFTILYGDGNIFYTLAFGLYICYCIDKFIPFKKRPIVEYLLLLPMMLLPIAPPSDYGIYGFLLIAALFLLRKHKPLQALAIVAWAFFAYNYIGTGFTPNWRYILGVAVAALLVLLYNNKKGYNVKWFFYAFYPAHLLVLGIISIILSFNAI